LSLRHIFSMPPHARSVRTHRTSAAKQLAEKLGTAKLFSTTKAGGRGKSKII
jgi:hypothetical protein